MPGTREHQIEAFTEDPATELSEMAIRLNRFNELGIVMQPNDVLDDLATDMAERAGFFYAMVNGFGEEQTFLGLHNPPRESGLPVVGRTMSRNHGYCPEVVERKRGLPLPDVAASPRFQSNHVVDAIGIESYFGSPIIDAATGLVLVTVCIIDPEPRTLRDADRLQGIVRDSTRAAADVLKIRTPAS
ncbi:GAF domain-containing protein [Streptomyces sp. V3I7]|uniref:GAF domain-containing protein n=1 Tax=Streptomyces sp. V3I7 TaxID=3042278 RepID=UPI0027D8311B|nr:GAF domain-containing protein [Streptomyces sp. V3I7]